MRTICTTTASATKAKAYARAWERRAYCCLIEYLEQISLSFRRSSLKAIRCIRAGKSRCSFEVEALPQGFPVSARHNRAQSDIPLPQAPWDGSQAQARVVPSRLLR